MTLYAKHMKVYPEHTGKTLIIMRVMTGRTDNSPLISQRKRPGYLYLYYFVYWMPRDGMIRDIAYMTISTSLHMVISKLWGALRVTDEALPLTVIKMGVTCIINNPFYLRCIGGYGQSQNQEKE